MELLNEYAKERLAKAEALKADGIPPYAGAFSRTHNATEIQKAWGHLQIGEHSQESVRFAGRIMTLRGQGKAGFATLADQGGRLQIYVKIDVLGEKPFHELFKRLDLGDFVGVEGPVFRTKSGELTVQASTLTLLSKSLLPPPDKWHGLKDVELRSRQRYLDLAANPEVRDNFMRRSAILSEIRGFLEQRGFLEVETPILQGVPGGAAARPFITHHNTLDMDLYLRIAPELFLKRLLVGGFEKVFEMNRNFRNEGISIKHNPEFTMVEVYEAYADGDAMMALTEGLIRAAAQRARGSLQLSYQGLELDFSKPFRRARMIDLVLETYPEAKEKERQWPPSGARLAELFEQHAEASLMQPTFVTDFPIEISPLAKRKTDDPSVADRFELFIYGRELANGFSELNDPMDQWQRFKDQLAAKAGGDEEAHPMDEDYVRALMHGMPPAGGLGLGVDRLVMLLTDAASIRDVILFPQLRKEE
jgi:lysyl-tRNA synthetase class 2